MRVNVPKKHKIEAIFCCACKENELLIQVPGHLTVASHAYAYERDDDLSNKFKVNIYADGSVVSYTMVYNVV